MNEIKTKFEIRANELLKATNLVKIGKIVMLEREIRELKNE